MAFQREFLIFKAEDSGFEAGQKPSGHVRIEVRDGNGKLWAAVQNLASGDGRLNYRLYLVKAGRDSTKAVMAGILGLSRNGGGLEWAFVSEDVNASGCNINEFNVFAVLAEYNDRESNRITCPLAAYREKGIEWRKAVEKLIYPKVDKSQIKLETESKNTPIYTSEEKVYHGKSIHTEPAESQYKQPESQYKQPESQYKQPESQHIQPESQYIQPESQYIQPESQYIQPESQYKQPESQYKQPENADAPVNKANSWDEGNTGYMEQQSCSQSYKQPMHAKASQAGNPDSNCLYMNGNMCGMYLDTSGPTPCSACKVHSNIQSSINEVKKGDLEKLKEQLNRNFEQNDPFLSKRSDYKWWKVLNPVNLNNIMYQCNIRSPLLFNPMVMMAHFKYRHLIIGIFTDKMRKREYIVCGVPGMHMVDRKPFGDMCKWVQAEGSRPKYGEFGYWVVYIDPDSGKILS